MKLFAPSAPVRSGKLALVMHFARPAIAAFVVGTSLLAAHGQVSGLIKPVILPAFDPTRQSCTKPKDMQRELVFVQDNDREFVQGVGRGLASAALERGLAYRVLRANNNAALMIKQIDGLHASKTGAIVVAPIDPPSLSPSLRRMIGSGSYVGAIVPRPPLRF